MKFSLLEPTGVKTYGPEISWAPSGQITGFSETGVMPAKAKVAPAEQMMAATINTATIFGFNVSSPIKYENNGYNTIDQNNLSKN